MLKESIGRFRKTGSTKGLFAESADGSSDSYWPIAEGFVFPKLDVQAAALEKSSRSAAAATPDPKEPLGIPHLLER